MFLTILIALSMASDFLVKAPDANPHEYAVYQQNNEHEKISNYFLHCSDANWLPQQLKKAQYQFLSGSLEESRILFQQIADRRWNCDWNEAQRKNIFYSLIRLAELSHDPQQIKDFFKAAIEFAPHTEPDSNVFPPPLIENFKKQKSSFSEQKVLIPASWQKWNHILRNGEFISLGGLTLNIPDGKARYTFVSETYLVETAILTPQELPLFQREARPLVSGSCDQFHLDESLKNLQNVKVFFSMQCQKNIPQTLQVPIEIPVAQEVPHLPEPANKNWMQRNFLWVGLATVGTVLLVSHISKKNQEQNTLLVPTTTAHR